METVYSSIPFLAMVVPLCAVALIIIFNDKPNLRESWTILASLTKFGLIVSMLPTILDGKVIECAIVTVLPGLDIKFKIDALGIFFALTASFLWILTSFYSIGYVRTLNEHAQTRYFICFAVAISATIGVAFSANVFTTYLFYEMITFSTYALVAHKETPEARQGARFYFLFLFGTSVAFFLSATFLTYYATGTLDFSNQGIFNDARGKGLSDIFLIVTFGLFIAGTSKAAMMPFHAWLPRAMVAPTPVSAFLHAVAVVKSGIFIIVKIVLHLFGINLLAELRLGIVLAYCASFTIIVSSVIALRQDNLKARLAYSTVAQLSYVIFGVALLTPSGITGSIMHIVIHAFGKITLFFCAGAIYAVTHKTKISELEGIGRKMPFTMVAFSLASLSLIGIPPLGGFISKWYLAKGAIEAGEIPLIAVLVVSSILNACYFLPIVYRAFFRNLPQGETAERKEAPAIMVVPLALTAIGTLVLFFVPSLFFDLAKIVVTNLN